MEKERCPICWEDIENQSFFEECIHQFCYKCIFTWTQESNLCPICKRENSRFLFNFKSDVRYDIYHIHLKIIIRSDSACQQQRQLEQQQLQLLQQQQQPRLERVVESEHNDIFHLYRSLDRTHDIFFSSPAVYNRMVRLINYHFGSNLEMCSTSNTVNPNSGITMESLIILNNTGYRLFIQRQLDLIAVHHVMYRATHNSITRRMEASAAATNTQISIRGTAETVPSTTRSIINAGASTSFDPSQPSTSTGRTHNRIMQMPSPSDPDKRWFNPITQSMNSLNELQRTMVEIYSETNGSDDDQNDSDDGSLTSQSDEYTPGPLEYMNVSTPMPSRFNDSRIIYENGRRQVVIQSSTGVTIIDSTPQQDIDIMHMSDAMARAFISETNNGAVSNPENRQNYGFTTRIEPNYFLAPYNAASMIMENEDIVSLDSISEDFGVELNPNGPTYGIDDNLMRLSPDGENHNRTLEPNEPVPSVPEDSPSPPNVEGGIFSRFCAFFRR